MRISCLTPDNNRVSIEAEFTTAHPLSSYGQPALILADGPGLDVSTWLANGYHLEAATPEEREKFADWWRCQGGDPILMNAALIEADDPF